jgi:L-gulonolactone oxidase
MKHAATTTSVTWRNWCGSARCTPARWITPTTEDEIVAAVQEGASRGLGIRVAGAGHSFNSLACTDGVLVDLSRYTGIVDIDRDAGLVTMRAGTSAGAVSEALDSAGLALPNMSTLAEQTVGGMLATGTHGTGVGFPPFAGHVMSVRLIAPDGSVRACSRSSNSELFRHVRCGLGTLGVITAMTVRCVPSFNLRVTERTERLPEVLDHFDASVRSADHVSFSFRSWSDVATVRRLDRTDAAVTRDAPGRRRANSLGEVRCAIVGQAGRLARGAVPLLAGGRNGSRAPEREFVDSSHRAFAFRQPVRFLSTEYAFPLARVAPVVELLREALRGLGVVSPYSVSVRVSASDDAPLSPAYGGETGYVNLTVPRTIAYLDILRVAEAVFLAHDGRPHWGKVHSASAAVLASRYPEWDAFQRMRARVDPDGLFTTDYVRHLLGPVGAAQPELEEATAR